jgi:hypothetical protein
MHHTWNVVGFKKFVKAAKAVFAGLTDLATAAKVFVWSLVGLAIAVGALVTVLRMTF